MKYRKKPIMVEVRRYPCPRCNGAGVVTDDRDEGALMRQARKATKVSLRDLARVSGLSVSYFCDAELGRRHWNARLRKAYREAGVRAERTGGKG